MSYQVKAALAKDAIFRDRVRVAVVSAAVDIMAETPTEKSFKDEKRGNLGWKILADGCGGALLDAFAFAVVANPAISDSSSDSDIQFTVNSVYDAVAGVLGKER